MWENYLQLWQRPPLLSPICEYYLKLLKNYTYIRVTENATFLKHIYKYYSAENQGKVSQIGAFRR